MRECPGAQPYFGDIDAMLVDMRTALERGTLTQGPQLEVFERAVAAMAGTRFAAGVSSCGAALDLILRAIGVDDCEVIVPTDTFVATPMAVVRAGGTPVFADVDRATLCLDIVDVERRVTSRTAAIIVVHMFGIMSPQLVALRARCDACGIALIEDAAHAHGAAFRGRPAGSIGIAGAFSFYATKVVATGEGGAVTTNDPALDERVRSLRNYGRSSAGETYDEVSTNMRLAELPAILGVHQLRTLDVNITHRTAIAQRYAIGLHTVDGMEFFTPDTSSTHSWWRFPILLDAAVDRARLQHTMAEDYGIRVTWMYEPLCHLQPAFRSLGHHLGDFPVAEDAMRRLICLPTHRGVSREDADRVVTALRETVPLCRNRVPSSSPA